MRNIENLVLQGGGVLGTAYSGAFTALQNAGLAGARGNKSIGNIKRVAGTSAGAIFSSVIALGYSAGELEVIALETDFSSFIDFGGNATDGYGVMGEAFLKWINGLINAKLAPDKKKNDPNHYCTFADLGSRLENNDLYKDLHVFGVNLDTKNVVDFSYATTPNTPIAYAVRASMSIPLVFIPCVMPEGSEYAGQKFVDGGVKYNFPITVFDFEGPNRKTLALNLSNLALTIEKNGLVNQLKLLKTINTTEVFMKYF